MAQLMNPPDFERLLTAVLTDRTFQDDMLRRGFRALDERHFDHGVPANMQRVLETAIFGQPGPGVEAKPKCGICGVCGLCGLCGEINFGSASAAACAAFHAASAPGAPEP
jgi:hypothetical protein